MLGGTGNMLFKANHCLPDTVRSWVGISGRHLEIGMTQDFLDKKKIRSVVHQP